MAYGPPPTGGSKKGLIIGGVVALLLVVAVVIGVTMSGSDDKEKEADKQEVSEPEVGPLSPPEVDGPDDTAPETIAPPPEVGPAEPSDDGPPPSGDAVPLGDTGTSGEFDVLVHEVEDPYQASNDFEEPEAGQRLVAVELTVTNTSGEESIFSTLAQMEAVDSESRSWDVAFAGYDRPQVDGSVAAGESRRGWVVFSVDENADLQAMTVAAGFGEEGQTFALK
jgi:hypothetical protein